MYKMVILGVEGFSFGKQNLIQCTPCIDVATLKDFQGALVRFFSPMFQGSVGRSRFLGCREVDMDLDFITRNLGEMTHQVQFASTRI